MINVDLDALIKEADALALEAGWLSKRAEPEEVALLREQLETSLTLGRSVAAGMDWDQARVKALKTLDIEDQNKSLQMMGRLLAGVGHVLDGAWVLVECANEFPAAPPLKPYAHAVVDNEEVYVVLPASEGATQIYEALANGSNMWGFCIFLTESQIQTPFDPHDAARNVIFAAHWTFDGTGWIEAFFEPLHRSKLGGKARRLG